MIKPHIVSVPLRRILKEQKESEPKNKSDPFIVAIDGFITPYTQQRVEMCRSNEAFLDITPIKSMEKDSRKRIVDVHGVVDAILQRPFNILVSNLNDKSGVLHKKCGSIGTSQEHHTAIFDSLWEGQYSHKDVSTVPIYEEVQWKEAQMDCHGKVKSADEEASKGSWGEYAYIAEDYNM